MQFMSGIEPNARRRRRERLLAVVLAVAAAIALWVVYAAIGIDLRTPVFAGYAGGAPTVSAVNVAFVSALAAFTAWGTLAVLERLTGRARSIWLVIAILALVASFGGPMSGTGITTANRIELLGLHLVVGGVLIPLLYGTSPEAAGASGGGREPRRTNATPDQDVAA